MPIQPLVLDNHKVDLHIKKGIRPVDVPYVHLIGKKSGLRSYDIGNSLLVSSNNVSLAISITGNEITVDYNLNEIKEATILCLGIGLSLSMMFRGFATLHAAGVRMYDSTIGIIAESGTGKSTLLQYLLSTDAEFVTDDVLPVDIISKEEIKIVPSNSLPMKLWKEQLQYFKLGLRDKIKIHPNIDKYWVQVEDDDRVKKDLPLNALFILSPTVVYSNEITIRELTLRDAVFSLLSNTHGVWSTPGRIQVQLLKKYALLARNIPIYVLEYFKHQSILPKLREVIVEQVSKI